MIAGTNKAVRIALRFMATLAQHPASSHSAKARAVAMPWLTVPRATPRADGELTPTHVRMYGPSTAPIVPWKSLGTPLQPGNHQCHGQSPSTRLAWL